MTHQNDSFIDEVTEDLRRDRLFNAFRRYGWIALLLIVAIVAGAAWREYSRAAAERDAEAFGDALLAAQAADDPAAALAAVPTGADADRKSLIALLTAAAQVEAGAREAAVTTLTALADDAGTSQLDRDLARLKLVTLRESGWDPVARDNVLADLSAAGRPFRLLALEQKAIALIAADREQDAATLIRQIQQEQGLSENQRRRLAETLVTLGLDEAGDAVEGDAPETAAIPLPAATPTN